MNGIIRRTYQTNDDVYLISASIGFPFSSMAFVMLNAHKRDAVVSQRVESASAFPGHSLLIRNLSTPYDIFRDNTNLRPNPNAIVDGSLISKFNFPSLRNLSGLKASGSGP